MGARLAKVEGCVGDQDCGRMGVCVGRHEDEILKLREMVELLESKIRKLEDQGWGNNRGVQRIEKRKPPNKVYPWSDHGPRGPLEYLGL